MVIVDVEQTLSIEKLYDKVRDYDIVFTSEAAMMSALNDRLEEPVLGLFATTPVIYTFEQFQNEELIQERGLFIELVRNTDLTWKQSSYLHPLQENRILGIGEENGSVKAVIFDVENDDPEIVDSEVLDDYYSSISSSHHAFQIDRENEVFFLPGSSGGHFFSYSDGLEEVNFLNMSDVRRGAFVNQNFYVFNDYKATVIDMENWETIKQIQFREEESPDPVPLPEPRIVE